MNISTNLPSGVRARLNGVIVERFKQIGAHLVMRGESRLPSNVSLAADEAYIAEKGVVFSRVLDKWPVGICARCHGVIMNVPFVKSGSEYCTQGCRDGFVGEKRTSKEAERQIDRTQAKWDKLAAQRAVKTGNLPTGWIWCAYEPCRGPFRPARVATIHCSSRCKRRCEQNQPQTEAA